MKKITISPCSNGTVNNAVRYGNLVGEMVNQLMSDSLCQVCCLLTWHWSGTQMEMCTSQCL